MIAGLPIRDKNRKYVSSGTCTQAANRPFYPSWTSELQNTRAHELPSKPKSHSYHLSDPNMIIWLPQKAAVPHRRADIQVLNIKTPQLAASKIQKRTKTTNKLIVKEQENDKKKKER